MTSDSASRTGWCEPHEQVRAARAVVARQAVREKTVRAAQAYKQKTNNERTNDGASRTDR